MKPKTPRAYHHGDLRQALVDASVAILREEGATALTLRSAARRVGVSHAAPKNHFGDLRGLLAAVATHGFHDLARALEAAKSGRDPRAGLVAAAEAYVRFAVGSPGAFRAMFHPALAERSLDPALEEASRAAFAALVGGVEAAQQAGVVSAGDTGGKSLTAWSFVHGLASLAVDAHLAGKGITVAPEVLAALGAGYLFDGLANETSNPEGRGSDGRLVRARGGSSSSPKDAANVAMAKTKRAMTEPRAGKSPAKPRATRKRDSA